MFILPNYGVNDGIQPGVKCLFSSWFLKTLTFILKSNRDTFILKTKIYEQYMNRTAQQLIVVQKNI